MNPKEKEIWMKEFNDFNNSSVADVEVPAHLFAKIKSKIFPSPWKVFGKVSVIHGVVGFLSLGICNQFGLNPFNTSYSLSEWFMQIAGHHFCMIACGILFMATTYILANFFLSLEEFESIRNFESLQFSILSLASVAAFYFFGAELVGSFVVLWLIGAYIGGYLSILGSLFLRRQFSI